MRKLFQVLFVLLVAGAAHAQTQTNVIGTIVDPNGIPYGNGTYSVQLVPTGNNPTVNGASIGGAFNGRLDANGAFNISLWPNGSIVPGSTTWQFTICISPGIQPPLGTGGQCTPPTPITISGASQNVSSTLNAVAPKLTTFIGSGSVTSVTGSAPIVSSGGATPAISCPTCNTSSATIAGSIANTQVAVGSGANTIAGSANFISTTGAVTVKATGANNTTLTLVPGAGAGDQTQLLAANNGVFQIIPGLTNNATMTLGGTGLQISAPVSGATQISFIGATSGGAALGVTAIAGTPNVIDLPTTTGTSGQVLQTDGGVTIQQASWVTVVPTVTLKTGSGAGNYTGTNTSYANVDATNLCLAVTVPSGWKLVVTATASLAQVTAVAGMLNSLSDIGTTCGGGGTTPLPGTESNLNPAAASTFDILLTMQAVIAGDGAAHAISMQTRTANAADAWLIQNGSSTATPSMIFTLTRSN